MSTNPLFLPTVCLVSVVVLVYIVIVVVRTITASLGQSKAQAKKKKRAEPRLKGSHVEPSQEPKHGLGLSEDEPSQDVREASRDVGVNEPHGSGDESLPEGSMVDQGLEGDDAISKRKEKRKERNERRKEQQKQQKQQEKRQKQQRQQKQQKGKTGVAKGNEGPLPGNILAAAQSITSSRLKLELIADYVLDCSKAELGDDDEEVERVEKEMEESMNRELQSAQHCVDGHLGHKYIEVSTEGAAARYAYIRARMATRCHGAYRALDAALLTLLPYLRSQKPLVAVFIGAGPGPDPVAFCEWLKYNGIRGQVELHIVELGGWERVWRDSVIPILKACYSNVTTHFSVQDAASMAIMEAIPQKTNLLMSSFALSELAAVRAGFSPVFDAIVQRLPPKSVLVLSDTQKEWVRAFKRYLFVRNAAFLQEHDSAEVLEERDSEGEIVTCRVDTWIRSAPKKKGEADPAEQCVKVGLQWYNAAHEYGEYLDTVDDPEAEAFWRQLVLETLWEALHAADWAVPPRQVDFRRLVSTARLESPGGALKHLLGKLLTTAAKEMVREELQPDASFVDVYEFTEWVCTTLLGDSSRGMSSFGDTGYWGVLPSKTAGKAKKPKQKAKGKDKGQDSTD